MEHKVVSVEPEYGNNYHTGYIGFTFKDNSFISQGIAWFTKWTQGKNPDVPDVPLSHVFVVTGYDCCVEATTPKVCFSPLSKYFDEPHTHVFFRKPTGWTLNLGTRIALAASEREGCSYGYTLIAGHAIANSVAGKVLDTVSFGATSKWFKAMFEKKHQFICSELASMAMKAQPEFENVGVLADHQPYEIDPQMLFQDTEIFTKWTKKVNGTEVKV